MKKYVFLMLFIPAVCFFALCYSTTWSERFLSPVQKRMSGDQVRSLVGSPLKIVTRKNATQAWYYDKWWSSDVVVYFDPSGHTIAVETD